MKDTFNHNRKEREEMGSLYREITAKYGDKVEILFLDPRNLLMIYYYFVKHIKAGNINVISGLKHLLMHLKRDAMFINGTHVKEDLEASVKQYF